MTSTLESGRKDVSRVSIRFGYSKSSLWLEGVLGSEGGFGESPKTDTSVSNGLEAYIYFESAEDRQNEQSLDLGNVLQELY
jgi:hypothetical protein